MHEVKQVEDFASPSALSYSSFPVRDEKRVKRQERAIPEKRAIGWDFCSLYQINGM